MNARRRKNAQGLRTGLLAVGVALMAGACSDSATGPSAPGELDTQTANARLDGFESFFQSSEWKSYEALGTRIGPASASASVVPGLEGWAVEAPSGAAGAAEAATRLLVSTQRIPLISAGSLGTTFAIDPTTGEYAPDPARTGAPANGVRFILYGLLPGTQDPDLSNEIGWVDLTDDGASSDGIDLRLTAVAEGVTFLEYGVALSGTETRASLGVDGFLRDGPVQLDFSFAANVSSDGQRHTLDVDATLDVEAEDLHVVLSADGIGVEEEAQGTLAFDLRVSYGADSIAIEATGTDRQISAVFRVNGEVFATAEGDPDQPVILGADGEPLSLDEVEVLEDVFEFFEHLVEPAGGIIELAVAL